MYLIYLILIVVTIFPSSKSSYLFDDLVLTTKWYNFKVVHNKTYSNSIEEIKRIQIFQANLQKIQRHNELYEQGLTDYTMKLNKFGDLNTEEFSAYVNKYQYTGRENRRILNHTNQEAVVLPTDIDWRLFNAVSEVKDQKDCGSCWSFSATGALEGQYALRYGRLLSLSEQNLIDCSRSYSNDGCDGGWMDYAFEYVEKFGIELESVYPYEAKERYCRYDPRQAVFKIRGYNDIPANDENSLTAAIAQRGPISIGIDATDRLQFYASGVFSDYTCDSQQLNHGVLVVGYGVDGRTPYYIIKNSWGPDWGEEGYVRILRNAQNHCGVATAGSYPII